MRASERMSVIVSVRVNHRASVGASERVSASESASVRVNDDHTLKPKDELV